MSSLRLLLVLLVFINPARADPCYAPITGIQYGGSTSGSIPYTTTGTNQLAIAYFLHYAHTGTAPSTTGMSQSGVTWQRRARVVPGTVSGIYQPANEEWYAVVPSAGSYSVGFTVDIVPNEGDVVIVVFSGSFATNRFDPNGSLPATAFDYSGSDTLPQVSGASTSASSSLLLTFCGQLFLGGSICNLPPSGWTNIFAGTDAALSYSAAYKQVTTPQIGITVPAAPNTLAYWVVIADALIGGSCILPSTVVPTAPSSVRISE